MAAAAPGVVLRLLSLRCSLFCLRRVLQEPSPQHPEPLFMTC